MDPIKLDLSQMSQVDKRILASRLYEAVKRFYEDPINQQQFEKRQKERGKQPKI